MTPNERPLSGSRSIARQAIATVLLTEIVGMLLLASLAVWHERLVRLHALDVLLQGRADSVFGAVQDAEDVNDTVRVDPRELTLPSGDYFTVLDRSGRVISSSDHVPTQLIDPGGETGHRNERVGRHLYRVLWQRRLRVIDRSETSGLGLERPVEIMYAVRIDSIWQDVFHGVGFFLGTSFALVLCMTPVLLLQLRRLLRPLHDLAGAAGAVSATNVAFQAPTRALQVEELVPLSSALTTMVERLREAFDLQHRFLGDATHELKTAVAVVRSTLEVLLLRRRIPEDYERGLHEAILDNKRVESLISRMLLLARLEERPALRARTVRVLEAVEQCLTILGSTAERAEVRLLPVQADCLESEPLAAITPVDFETLLTNVLVNAIEHSGSGSDVLLRIRCDGSIIELSIIDNGRGIPEEVQPHLFERFFRADQSRARSTGGAGLGLAISKAIVDANDGHIAITSRVEVGTTITVTLPRVD